MNKLKKILVLLSLIYPIALSTSTALMEILSVLWAVVALVYIITNRRNVAFKKFLHEILNLPDIAIILYIIWCAVTTAFQRNLPQPLANHLGPLRIFLLYFLARYTFSNRDQIYKALRIMLYFSCLGLLSSFVQYFFEFNIKTPNIGMVMSEFGLGVRAMGLFNSPLTYANVYMSFFLISFAMLIFLWRKHFTKERIMLFLYVLVSFFGVFISGCRYLFYTVPLSIFSVLWLKSRKLALSIILIMLSILGITLFTTNMTYDKISDFINLKQRSNYNRVKLWVAYSDLVKDNLIFGVGLNNEAAINKYLKKRFKTFQSGHSHNHFLQVLAETGVPGLILFLVIQLSWLFMLYRAFLKAESRSQRAPLVAGIAVLISFNLAGMTQYTYGDTEVFYGIAYLMGLLVMMARKTNENQ